MRGRSILLIASGALLLALLVGMKMWLADDAAKHEPPVVPITSLDQPLVPPVVTAPTREARIPPPRLVRPQPGEVPAVVGSAAAPVVVEAPSPPMMAPPDQPRSTTPIADKATLRDQMNAVEPQVRACLDQLGGTASGTALLTWTVAPKGAESIVESSGVDYDATSISDEKLLTCLHETAKAMKFAGVPGALPVLGRRKLTIENGKLVSQQFISFSRIY